MTHRNAPLSIEGRRRLIERCRTRPVAHVAAEMGISRACAYKWVRRYREGGEQGLIDRPSTAHHHPTAIPDTVIARIEVLRRDRKWSARRIARELGVEGAVVSVRTVGRYLVRLGINHRRHLDTTGNTNRVDRKIVARYAGHMVHVDIKKVGRIPDGGGWRVHGRGSAHAKRVQRRKTGGARAGYVYLHSMIDGYSRLAYTEALPDEKASTAVGFGHRGRSWFAAHGIGRITRMVTDNGSCYRATEFAKAVRDARHQRIKPYTPRHNGKVERYNRILAEEFLYAREWSSEQHRSEALHVWNIHYNYHRSHTAIGDRPPAALLRDRVTNVMASNRRCGPERRCHAAAGARRGAAGSADTDARGSTGP